MREENGFTIVEALVAIAILSIALIPLYGVGSDLLRVTTHISSNDRAILFAQSKLETLALVSTPLPWFDEGEDNGFHWQVTAHNLNTNTPWQRQVLQDVNLLVTWRTGGHERTLSVTTRHLGRAVQ